MSGEHYVREIHASSRTVLTQRVRADRPHLPCRNLTRRDIRSDTSSTLCLRSGKCSDSTLLKIRRDPQPPLPVLHRRDAYDTSDHRHERVDRWSPVFLSLYNSSRNVSVSYASPLNPKLICCVQIQTSDQQ